MYPCGHFQDVRFRMLNRLVLISACWLAWLVAGRGITFVQHSLPDGQAEHCSPYRVPFLLSRLLLNFTPLKKQLILSHFSLPIPSFSLLFQDCLFRRAAELSLPLKFSGTVSPKGYAPAMMSLGSYSENLDCRMWSIWMFTIPALRARECTAQEKEALNILFLLVPLINVGLPFIWKSFPFIFTADCAALALVYTWKIGLPGQTSSWYCSSWWIIQSVFLKPIASSFPSLRPILLPAFQIWKHWIDSDCLPYSRYVLFLFCKPQFGMPILNKL